MHHMTNTHMHTPDSNSLALTLVHDQIQASGAAQLNYLRQLVAAEVDPPAAQYTGIELTVYCIGF
jgi:hypothetical protein